MLLLLNSVICKDWIQTKTQDKNLQIWGLGPWGSPRRQSPPLLRKKTPGIYFSAVKGAKWR